MSYFKRNTGLLLSACAVLGALLLTGCGGGTGDTEGTVPETSAVEETALQPEAATNLEDHTQLGEDTAVTEPVHEHSWSEWAVETIPTCIEAGSEKRTCACGEAERREIAATGHTWSEWTTDVTPTCTEDGVEKRTCACGESESRKISASHTYADGKCELCGALKPSEGLEFFSNGNGTCFVGGLGQCTDTVIVIPSVSPNGERVTRIGDYAFAERSGLTGVVIPNGVTSISDNAFAMCSDLASITIPDSVTSIGRRAFFDCGSLTSITFTGTMAKWASIEKQEFWAEFVRTDTVHCIDGDTAR